MRYTDGRVVSICGFEGEDVAGGKGIFFEIKIAGLRYAMVPAFGPAFVIITSRRI